MEMPEFFVTPGYGETSFVSLQVLLPSARDLRARFIA